MEPSLLGQEGVQRDPSLAFLSRGNLNMFHGIVTCSPVHALLKPTWWEAPGKAPGGLLPPFRLCPVCFRSQPSPPSQHSHLGLHVSGFLAGEPLDNRKLGQMITFCIETGGGAYDSPDTFVVFP